MLSRVSFTSMLRRKDHVTKAHLAALSSQLRQHGVQVLRGFASLRSPHQVSVEPDGTYEASTIVIATGSRARRPGRFRFDDKIVCDSESIFLEAEPPRTVVIVGAEIEGCEFACLFASLGIAVTLLERRRKLLRAADREILSVLHAAMHNSGIHISLEEKITDVSLRSQDPEPHAIVKLESGRVELCDRLLVLAGREARTEGLGLDRLGIGTDVRGFISVNEHFQTSHPGVYAVGDVAGPPFRAGIGMHQGRTAILHATRRTMPEPLEVPTPIYTIPEVAVTGLGEEACRRLDLPYGVGTSSFAQTLNGQIRGANSGLLKLIFSSDDLRIVGVQVIGENAAELIHLGLFLIQSRTTLEEVAGSVFTSPSFSEAYRLAALDGLAGRIAGSATKLAPQVEDSSRW